MKKHNVTLHILQYSSQNGSYLITFYEKQYYFVHISKYLNGSLNTSINQNGVPNAWFTGDITIKNDKIYLEKIK